MIKSGALPLGLVSLLGYRKALDMNSTADQTIAMPGGRYIIRRIIGSNASISLTTASGGIYTSPNKLGGTAIVSSANTYAALTDAGKFKDLTLQSVAVTDALSGSLLYFSLLVAQGSAATADIYIFGDRLP